MVPNLTQIGRKKPLAACADLFVLLINLYHDSQQVFKHERYRITLHAVMHVLAYTAARPGALVQSTASPKDSIRSLRYEDIKLYILPHPNRPLIVMELEFWFVKGRRTTQDS